jgi:RNA 2',3'-cyclic 3'-phosphodiesterase
VRLFVAVGPPDDVLTHLAAAVDAVRADHPDLQWVPPQRWHLTLAFYGEVPDADVGRASRRVARAARGVAPIPLSFTGAGRFGDRVVWVGVAGDVDRLRSLAEAAAVERRPYRPHLTVARVRRGGDSRAAADALSSYAGPGWSADEVRLVRSWLGPQPRHETIGAWPLRPPG